MTYCFRNLIFEGGGVKGIGYVGALQVLEEKEILDKIIRVGGSSAGSVVAMLVGLNYSRNEINDILSTLDFRNFLDDSWGIIRDVNSLIDNFGWYRGDFFQDWVEKLIKKKTGIDRATFADVKKLQDNSGFKDMYFIGTNLSTRYSEVFSHEHTPQMCVSEAIRISISIPFFFAAPRNNNGDCYTDGGILENYPIRLFDRQSYVSHNFIVPDYYHQYNFSQEGGSTDPYVYNQETLGFRLDSRSEIAIYQGKTEPPHYPIDNFFDFAWSLIETILEIQNNLHLNSYDWPRTIYIDTLGVGTTDFGIDDETKKELIQSGRECTDKYFAWYEDPENLPVNHPANVLRND